MMAVPYAMAESILQTHHHPRQPNRGRTLAVGTANLASRRPRAKAGRVRAAIDMTNSERKIIIQNKAATARLIDDEVVVSSRENQLPRLG